jgi:pimeloyl-ACP methyl ester carboxylesterase
VSDEPAILIGHDWGAPIAYHAAIRHPEQFAAVAGLSVPHLPPQPVSMLDVFDLLYADRFFYQLSFREPGVIEAQFDQDLRGALERVFHALSGDAPDDAFVADAPRETPFLEVLPDPPDGPLSFMSDADLDLYAEAFRRSGTVGGFNRYRAAGLDVVANADIMGATVEHPSYFIAGERDAVRSMVPGVDMYEDPGAGCTDFRGRTIVPGVGHWVQQEAPAEVNAALDAFLATL